MHGCDTASYEYIHVLRRLIHFCCRFCIFVRCWLLCVITHYSLFEVTGPTRWRCAAGDWEDSWCGALSALFFSSSGKVRCVYENATGMISSRHSTLVIVASVGSKNDASYGGRVSLYQSRVYCTCSLNDLLRECMTVLIQYPHSPIAIVYT